MAGGPYAITVDDTSGLSAANYDFAASLTNGELTVTPAHLTVQADDLSRAYGVANPTLTYTITGFVNGEHGSPSGATAPRV